MLTREEAKRRAELYSALAKGKTIQIQCANGEWTDVQINSLLCIDDDRFKYRIKPEPKYRPFKNQEECWNEMQKHQPFGWIRNIDIQSLYNIEYVGHNTYGRWINNSIVYFNTAFNDYNFADGTPFGIKEEENE